MAIPTSSEIRPPAKSRLPLIDLVRGAALIAMASYHFLWDLADFGYLDPSFPATGWPKIYARSIATTFLFLAGLSLVLGHRDSIRWRSFFLRLTKIVAAAALVSAASAIAMPQGLIFFGILHAMAVSSLIGLAFLRLPAFILVLVGLLAIAAPHFIAAESFNHPWLWWLGLSTQTRISFDFVPILPWFGPFLLGMAAAKSEILLSALRQNADGAALQKRWKSLLSTLGRHSLVFYLVHQPVLIAALYCASLIVPPPVVDPSAQYINSCQAGCAAEQGAEICRSFCACTLDRLIAQDLLIPFQSGAISVGKDERIKGIAVECSSQSLP